MKRGLLLVAACAVAGSACAQNLFTYQLSCVPAAALGRGTNGYTLCSPAPAPMVSIATSGLCSINGRILQGSLTSQPLADGIAVRVDYPGGNIVVYQNTLTLTDFCAKRQESYLISNVQSSFLNTGQNNGTNVGAPQGLSRRVCSFCGGIGRVHSSDGMSLGLGNKWCAECGCLVNANHVHLGRICPSCMGKGYIESSSY